MIVPFPTIGGIGERSAELFDAVHLQITWIY
jgi:hypothetical protein